MGSIEAVIWIVAFVLVTVTITGVAGRFGLSAPFALVAIGAGASFLPWVPNLEIEPDLVLYGVLPPLLYAAAVRTSYIDIRARGDSILLLSVGLVAFTFVTVGFTAWLAIPGITLAAALAFGAVVAPTDAVAVTAIAGRLPLPRRLVTILEGESLLNDAAALVALTVSISAITSTVTPGGVALELLLAVVVGVGIGLVVGWLLAVVRKQLASAVLDTSLSLVTPYIAFIPAQLLHGSGILAVVIAGLFLGFRSPSIQSAEARIAESINWRTVRYLLENAVFLLIGLTLSSIAEDALRDAPSLGTAILIIVAVLLAVLLSRLVWVLLTTLLYRVGPSWLRERRWSWRNGIAVGVAGIRGVVTLAAVFLLPEETPHRGFLQFLAFVVIAGSLLGGLALPVIIRLLRLPAPNMQQEQTQRRLLLAEVRSAGLERLDAEASDDDEERVLHRLRTDATFLEEDRDAAAMDGAEQPEEDERDSRLSAYTRLRRGMIDAEREAVRSARSEGRYEEYAVRAVLAAIDAEELALRAAMPDSVHQAADAQTAESLDEAAERRGD